MELANWVAAHGTGHAAKRSSEVSFILGFNLESASRNSTAASLNMSEPNATGGIR